MPDPSTNFVIMLLPSLVTGVVVAIVSHLLSGRRATTEKFWELRRIAYGSILAQFSAIETIITASHEYISYTDEYVYFESTISFEHNTSISHCMAAIREVYSHDYLILSDAFVHLIEDFFQSLGGGTPNDGPADDHERFVTAFRAARPKLLKQSRSEMPVRRSLIHWFRISFWKFKRQPVSR